MIRGLVKGYELRGGEGREADVRRGKGQRVTI